MPRILIIDDDPQIRNMLKMFLEMNGHVVEAAEDGLAGLKLFGENGADLVITDVIMPEKEGIETIRELRRDHPDIKIIAISGGGQMGSETYLRMARAFGAAKTLQKPFALKELLAAVQEVLNHDPE